MKAFRVFFLALLLFSSGCKKDTTAPETANLSSVGSSVIVDGTVLYREGGGTREIIYPPAFILTNCQWITRSADNLSTISLSGAVDSSSLNKKVRVYGKIDTLLAAGLIGGKYPNIVADSLQVY